MADSITVTLNKDHVALITVGILLVEEINPEYSDAVTDLLTVLVEGIRHA